MNKISRRKFITVCAMGTAAAAVYSVFPACSKSGGISQDEFIKLSSVLTGFKPDELDKTLAAEYYKSLTQFPPSKASLGDIYKTIGLGDGENPGKTFIEGTIFTNNEEKIFANTIIKYWYTGTYKTAQGMKVSNYQQAYAWKATGYLIPNAQCRGTFGFWQNKPNIS